MRKVTATDLPFRVLQADMATAIVLTAGAQRLLAAHHVTVDERWFAAIWLAHATIALGAIVAGLRWGGPVRSFRSVATVSFASMMLFPGMLVVEDAAYLPVLVVAAAGLAGSRLFGRRRHRREGWPELHPEERRPPAVPAMRAPRAIRSVGAPDAGGGANPLFTPRSAAGTDTAPRPDVVIRKVDWSVWVPTPPWLGDHPKTDERWAAEHAERVFARARREPTAQQRDFLRLQLLVAGRCSLPAPEGGWVWKGLHLPSPDDTPVPAYLAVAPAGHGDPDGDLRYLAGVGDPALVEPPLLEEVITPLGTGLRSLAYTTAQDRSGAAELVATLGFAWRVEGPRGPHNVRLWLSWTPSRVIAATDDVERLAGCLRLGPAAHPARPSRPHAA